jgi:hypothetical protein
VHVPIPESFDENTLEHVNALLWCVEGAVRTELAKRLDGEHPLSRSDAGL